MENWEIEFMLKANSEIFMKGIMYIKEDTLEKAIDRAKEKIVPINIDTDGFILLSVNIEREVWLWRNINIFVIGAGKK